MIDFATQVPRIQQFLEAVPGQERGQQMERHPAAAGSFSLKHPCSVITPRLRPAT